ncbi:MAG: hypothetical protein IJ681_01825 [Bacteroidales bacterium]|nr:hypothetical protein [Bacteroidales bacterium]
MGSLVLIILFGLIVSFLTKSKKDTIIHSNDNKKSFEDPLSKSFKGSDERNNIRFEYETSSSVSDKSVLKSEQSDEKRVKNVAEDSNSKIKKFNLKQAVIYSTILDRPY